MCVTVKMAVAAWKAAATPGKIESPADKRACRCVPAIPESVTMRIPADALPLHRSEDALYARMS